MGFNKIVAIVVLAWLFDYSVGMFLIGPNLPERFHFQHITSQFK